MCYTFSCNQNSPWVLRSLGLNISKCSIAWSSDSYFMFSLCRRVFLHRIMESLTQCLFHIPIHSKICQMTIKNTIFAADTFVSIRTRAVEGVHFIVTSSAIHTWMTVAFIDFCKYSNNILRIIPHSITNN